MSKGGSPSWKFCIMAEGGRAEMNPAENDRSNASDRNNLQLGHGPNDQLATMSTAGQVITEGPTQVGEGNTLNQSTNIYKNTYNTFHINFCQCVNHPSHQTGAPNSRQRQEVVQQIQDVIQATQQQTKPQCKRCDICEENGHPPITDQSELSFIQVATETSVVQSLNRQPLPSRPKADSCGQSRSSEKHKTNGHLQQSVASEHSKPDRTNPVPERKDESMETKCSTERDESCSIVDTNGQELQPGDVVCVVSGYTGYWTVYVGDLHLIRCDRKTQKVKRETLDLRQPFYRLTAISKGRCKVFSPEERVQRAVYSEGRQSPVEETCGGQDFVTWVCTGLREDQAWSEGFCLW